MKYDGLVVGDEISFVNMYEIWSHGESRYFNLAPTWFCFILALH